MGEVYLAEDTKLNRQVAIKVLPPRIAHQPVTLERFAREASAIGALNHPNIVTIHAVEEVEGLRLIVMERVEGRTLSSLLPEDGLEPEDFLELAIPLAEAVAAAHARGVIHRDIKPANVMVTGDNRVKVVDFGLAKLRPGDNELGVPANTLTQVGHLVGTVTYMSPEQLRGEGADVRSDVFALGTLLYEMATGHHPFDGETQPVVISSILSKDPDSVSSVHEGFPNRLDPIIGRCLAKEPAERFADASELHSELVALKQELDSERILRQGRGPFGRAKTWALGAIGALVLVAGSWWLAQRAEPSADRPPAAIGTTVVPPPAAARPTVAVLHFLNLKHDTEREWLRTGLADMLATDLSLSPAIRVVPPERIYDLFGALPARASPAVLSEEEIRAIGEQAGADAVVSGNFFEIDGQLAISFRLISLPSAEVLISERLVGESEASLLSLVDQLSSRVRAQLEVGGTASHGDRDLGTVTTASPEAYRYYLEGRNLEFQVKLVEAVPLLEKAVEIDPGFAMAWARLSVVFRALGRDADSRRAAENAYSRIDRLPPREQDYVRGLYYGYRRDTYPQAIEAYRRLLAREPEDRSARYDLAVLLSYSERGDEAIAHLERLRAEDTEIPGVYLFLAHEYATRNDFETGFRLLETAARRHPDSHWHQMTLGYHLAQWGRPEEAREALDRAEALRPGDSHLLVARWHAAVLRGDWHGAEEAAEAGRAGIDPFSRFSGARHLAWLRLYQGRLRAALALIEDLTALDPADALLAAQSHELGAQILLQVERPAEALDHAREARRIAPGSWPAWQATFWAALAYEALGDHAAADRMAAEIDPEASALDRRYARHLAGRLALARGRVDQARAALEEAVSLLPARGFSWQLVPDHVVLWQALAEAAEADGDEPAAIGWYLRIAESTTERVQHPLRYVRSHYHLGRLYARAGELDRARDAYRRFLALWGDGELDRERIAEARRTLE